MPSTGLKAYIAGPKKNWRRWAWNRIVEGVKERGIRLRDAQILYMPGPNDADRQVAIGKGFADPNLIPISSDKGIVQSLRNDGRNVIHGRIETFMRFWPETFPLDGVIADFCAGVEISTARFAGYMYRSAAIWPGTRIVINLQRGRDYNYIVGEHKGKDHLDHMKSHINCVWKNLRQLGMEIPPRTEYSVSNRALHVLGALLHEYGDDEFKCVEMIHDISLPSTYVNDLITHAVMRMMPRFKSYRSSSVIMDSMALRYPEAWTPEGIVNYREWTKEEKRMLRMVKRHIAAFKAIRTRRGR